MLIFRNIIKIIIYISYNIGLINCHLSLDEGSRCEADNLVGYCTKLSTCQSVVLQLQTGRIKFKDMITCSILHDTIIVCCLDNAKLKHTYIKQLLYNVSLVPSPDNVNGRTNEINEGEEVSEEEEYISEEEEYISEEEEYISEEEEYIYTENEYIIPVTITAKAKENIVYKTNKIKIKTKRNLRNSDKACQRYRSVKKGLQFNKITDELPVEKGEFPHMVALGYPSTKFGSDFSWGCGGTLISERYILTAAHCTGRVDPTMVRMGKLSLDSNLDNLTAVDIPVEKIVVHPEYSSLLKYHDVALIRLANDIKFESGRILPACLSNQMIDVTSNTTLWATGWGVVSTNNRSRSVVLLKANLTSYDLMTCNQTYIDNGVTDQYPTGLNNGQLCAGDPEGKKDTCQGDSFGPLQYLDGTNEMSVVIGITSFSASCGTKIPSVYARVAFYLDWIESVAWP